MPIRCEKASCFLERGPTSKVDWIVGWYIGVGFLPLRVLSTKVRTVELIIAVDPATQHHQLHPRQHLGVVISGIFRMSCVSKDLYQWTRRTAELSWRQVRAIKVALIASPERSEFGNDGAG